ncbi:MAG: imidazole glycerol phosphate synthase subunit HisH [Verrucomicrobia bacterium]|nr:imidazole glycerol phosphate synthase subunit HisH [Verrucomicrobiota bacterium]
MKAALLDYGRGNLRSVERALAAAGAQVTCTEKASDLSSVECLVVPGQGSFGDAIQGLKERGLWEPLQGWIRQGKPYLGICLGFQILWEGSEEAPGVEGLKVIPGMVRKFSAPKLKVPLIGWCEVKPTARAAELFAGGDRYFYHVHSYRPERAPADWLACETEYGGWFPSGVWKGKVAAFQFHPEKSQDSGIDLLRKVLAKIA